jgi:hypothetical protein
MVQLSTFIPSLSKKSTSLYGHSLGRGVQENWDSYHAECQVSFRASPSDAEQEAHILASQLKELGQANLGVYNTTELSQKIERAFIDLDSRELSAYLPRESTGGFAPDIFTVLQSVSPIVEEFYGSHFQPYWISLQQNHPGTASATSSFGWHIDDNPRQLMKIFIYFNDVYESNGAFRAFTQPVSRQLLQDGFMSWSEKLRRDNQSMIDDYVRENPSDLQVLEGQAGTVLMFDNNLVHKGTPPRVGYRQLAQIEIYPSMTPLTEKQVELALTMPLVNDYPKEPRENLISGHQPSR